jgi:hypothetical protein
VADLNGRVVVLNSECKYVMQFGSAGSGNGQLKSPSDVAFDGSWIWVLDAGNYRIEKFNSAGTYQTQCGSQGTGDGQLSSEASTIAVNGDGNVVVGDTAGGRVEEFSSKCEYLSKFTTASSGAPESAGARFLAIDSVGNIWTSRGASNQVMGFFPEGEYVTKFGESGNGNGQFNWAAGVAIGANDTIWVLDRQNGRVQKWSQARPAVETGRASSVKRSETSLNGTINPEGTATSYQFEYGTTTSFGSMVPASPKSIGSGSSGVKFSEALSGLKAGTTYYYHVVATSSKGTVDGETRHFTTLPAGGVGAQIRIGGKTFTELGITEASVSISGGLKIEFTGFSKATLECSESGTGKLASTALSSETVTVKCSVANAPKCTVEPMTYTVNGSFASKETTWVTVRTSGEKCGIDPVVELASPSGSFQYGSEAVSMNVLGTATTLFGGNPVYITSNSKWSLSGANAGKALGFW